jgi:hypothetical protein
LTTNYIFIKTLLKQRGTALVFENWRDRRGWSIANYMPILVFVKGVGSFYLLTYQVVIAYYLFFVVIRPGKIKTGYGISLTT